MKPHLAVFPFLAFTISGFAQTPDPGRVIRAIVEKHEKYWERLADPVKDNSGSRDLFLYGLGLCETGEHPERLARLFDLGRRMQDRDPQSKGYGNFRWSWNNAGVLDFNAVDFCMQAASVLWLRHHDTLPADARVTLLDVIGPAIEGSLHHKVKSDYTNIALMNASNLILLGESLGKPDVAEEGCHRLDNAFQYIRKNGIHKYGSPTYYGVDLNDLLILEALTRNDRARGQARALLDFLWTDIALNWFEPAQRYSGPNSRSYDDLYGHGDLDDHLSLNGWMGESLPGPAGVFACLGKWHPPASLKSLSLNRFPRTVRQRWGENDTTVRTNYLTRDVALGCSGANYANMDMPLTVDLPGPQKQPRCYFIPDGRHDPYGTIKIADSTAHRKTLHLKPFFAGAQRKTDALCLALYRDADVPADTRTLESHFVIPMEVNALHVGDRAVACKDMPWDVELKPGDAVTLQKGTAVVGIRVLWARGQDGAPASLSLVYDGNPFKAVRLTVDHRMGQGIAKPNQAGAALWVRVGSDVKSAAAYDAWRRKFAEGKPESHITQEGMQFTVPGVEGPLTVAAKEPFKTPLRLDPPVPPVVLDLDGEDIGARILDSASR